MVLGLRVQLGGLHRAVQVAAALNTTEVPLRNEASPCPTQAASYGHALGRLILSFQSDIYFHSRTPNLMPILF